MPLLFAAPDRLATEDGRAFDFWQWRWSAPGAVDAAGRPVTPFAALEATAGQQGRRLLPVGVIGPRTATPAQCVLAESLGRLLARMGLPVLCGGKTGVMEAVACGVRAAGGLSLALLPEDDWRGANESIALPLATGLGKARNVVIAQASAALVAVGGEYGTLTEIAFGLHFGKPVFALDAAPDVPGLRRLPSAEAAAEAVAEALLAIPG